MNDRQMDAPSLPERSREDFAGSLADHVRQYATDDPEEAALRDRLAGAAQGFAEHHRAAPETPEEADAGPWDVPPPGRDAVLDKNGDRCTVSGGLWTNERTGQQFGHGYFVNAFGPFRSAEPNT